MLVRRNVDGTLTRLTPEGFNARSRVHEYGGAAVLISGDLIVVSDFVTGRLNRVVAPEQLEPLTPEKAWRYADAIHDAAHNRLIAVREDHEEATVASHGEWNNDLVAIDLATGARLVARRGLGLLRRAATVARRLDARLARVAPPEHALGRHRAASRARGRRRLPRAVAHRRRQPHATGSASPRWSPERHRSTSSPSPRAG